MGCLQLGVCWVSRYLRGPSQGEGNLPAGPPSSAAPGNSLGDTVLRTRLCGFPLQPESLGALEILLQRFSPEVLVEVLVAGGGEGPQDPSWKQEQEKKQERDHSQGSPGLLTRPL